MSARPMLTHEQAIRRMLDDPACADTVRDNYLGDSMEAATRFQASAEFAEVMRLLADRPRSRVLDVGAGNGMASYAFARSGASVVYAIEPDESALVGRGAIRAVIQGLPIYPVAAVGEALPLSDSCVDVVYLRATLHHVRDLDPFVAECARVLRPGGTFIACREHVVESEGELRRFLADHPVHKLAGGEHAYSAKTYANAIVHSGLRLEHTLGPWDSVINAFPQVQNNDELRDLIGTKMRRRLGPLRGLAPALRLVEPLLALWAKRPFPGRLYSYVATKP